MGEPTTAVVFSLKANRGRTWFVGDGVGEHTGSSQPMDCGTVGIDTCEPWFHRSNAAPVSFVGVGVGEGTESSQPRACVAGETEVREA